MMSQEIETPTRGYLLCCIERTGSNLLADALIQTGAAGRPYEYFSPVLQDTPWMRGILGDSTMLTGLPKILRAAATANGVFGTKLHWVHLRHLAIALSDERGELPAVAPGAMLKVLEHLPKLMPTERFLQSLRERAVNRPKFPAVYRLFKQWLPDLRVIWLTRNNMLARAISHARALHSNIWQRPAAAAAAGNPSLAAPPPEFDLAQIHQLHVLGLFQEESWQLFFDELAITPHHVVYENLVANYEHTVRDVLKFLGLDDAVKSIEPSTLLRQTDALSEEWEQRYRKLSAEAGLE